MKNKTKSGFTIIAAICAVIVMSGETEGSWVPDKYQTLYSYLEEKLNNFDSYLDSQWDGKKYDVTFGAELSTVNANRGSSLLREDNYKYTLLYLDRLQAMGVQGIKITIAYPLLVSGFPDSDKYLEFYTKLSKEIREKRKMKLLVQTTPLFIESEFVYPGLVLKEYYQDLNLAKYKQEKREQIKKVLTYIQPDLLTVEIEPGTMARNTGLRELYNPKTFREVIEYQIRDMQKGNTLIGAGIGTWDDKEFAKELVRISKLDYLDIHIYPITKDYLQRALDYSDLAKSQNKKVISGEAWLYKATEKEVKQGGATVMEAFRRDVFSFWIPLDKKFHEVLIKLAHYKQFDFISPFWTRHYFAYLDHNNRTKDLPAGKLFTKVNREAFKNLVVGEFTETALHYKKLISGDNSPGETKENYQRDCLVKEIKIIQKNAGHGYFSPSGDLIVFDKQNTDKFFNVYIMKQNGTVVKGLTENNPIINQRHNGWPAWHPTKDYIVFESEEEVHYKSNDPRYRYMGRPGMGLFNNLWAMTTDGKKAWKLTDVDTKQTARDGIPVKGVVNPIFSHDGNKLMWTERYDGGGYLNWGMWQIKMADFVIDKQGPHLENENIILRAEDVCQNCNYVVGMGFSPIDERKILISGNLNGQHVYGMDQYIFDINTKELINLQNTPECWEEGACWSPDGKKIVYPPNIGSPCKLDFSDPTWQRQPRTREYWIMNADGSNKRQLTYFNTPGSVDYLNFGKGRRVIVAECSFSKDGTMMLGNIGFDQRNDDISDIRVDIGLFRFTDNKG